MHLALQAVRHRSEAPETLVSDDADPRSDEALMLAYAAGDAHTFARLYARHRRSLFGFLWRGLQDHAAVEECFPDVWSRVVQARERYRPEARFGHLVAADRSPSPGGRMAQTPTTATSDEAHSLEHVVDERADPEQDMNKTQTQQRLHSALHALPDEQRVAVQLRLSEEMPLEQIAQITGVGRETVKSRLRYAIDKLRASLSP